MSSQKACPRRATRRLMTAARHRAFMAELFGQCVILDGRRVQMAARTALTEDEAARMAQALDQVLAAVKRAYDAQHAGADT